MSREARELRLAQAAAERARVLLLFPSAANLDRSRVFLEQACASLEALRCSVGGPGGRGQALLAGLGVLRQTARRVGALLDSAARFRGGWFEAFAAAAAGGYTRQGAPAPSVPPRSLSLEG